MLDVWMMAVLLGSTLLIGLLIHWCNNQVESEE